MEQKIWRKLIQILSYRDDLIEENKPFLERLYNKSNNKTYDLKDDNYISFLQTFPLCSLQVLYHNEIIEEKKYLSLTGYQKKNPEPPNQDQTIEEIIKQDNLEKLQRFILDHGIDSIKTISKPFLDVKKMAIPIIIYCIIQKAIKCFKYLLINEIQDPSKTMEEENPIPGTRFWESEHRYEWDCMAIAIYYGDVEIMKILEDKGFEKGNKLSHIETAVLSFRKPLVKEIINKFEENDEIQNILLKGIFIAIMINNIRVFEFLYDKGKNLNIEIIVESSLMPIHYAALASSKEIVEILISKNVDINAKTIFYQTMIIFI